MAEARTLRSDVLSRSPDDDQQFSKAILPASRDGRCGANLMAWFKRFADPIVLDDGSALLTFRDAAKYIRALPEAERGAAHWKIAMKALTVVAECNGAELLARIAVLMALNDGKPPLAPKPQRKPHVVR
jgi:hypothetical protein